MIAHAVKPSHQDLVSGHQEKLQLSLSTAVKVK